MVISGEKIKTRSLLRFDWVAKMLVSQVGVIARVGYMKNDPARSPTASKSGRERPATVVSRMTSCLVKGPSRAAVGSGDLSAARTETPNNRTNNQDSAAKPYFNGFARAIELCIIPPLPIQA